MAWSTRYHRADGGSDPMRPDTRDPLPHTGSTCIEGIAAPPLSKFADLNNHDKSCSLFDEPLTGSDDGGLTTALACPEGRNAELNNACADRNTYDSAADASISQYTTLLDGEDPSWSFHDTPIDHNGDTWLGDTYNVESHTPVGDIAYPLAHSAYCDSLHSNVPPHDFMMDSMTPKQQVDFGASSWNNEFGIEDGPSQELLDDPKMEGEETPPPSPPESHVVGAVALDHEKPHENKRPQGQRSERRSAMIKAWYLAHGSPVYPSSDQIKTLVISSGLSKQQVMQCLSNLRARTKPRSPSQALIMQSGGFQTSSFAEQSAPFKPYRAKVQTMPADHHDDIKYNGDHFERIHLDQLEPPSSLIVPQHRASQPKRRQMQSGFLHSTRLKRKGKRQPTFRSTDKSSELTYSSPNKSSDNGPDVSNMYNCTACYKPFKNFYGWKRHEFGVHGHNDIEWVCMLDGDILLGSKCVFCTQVVYDMSHFGIHGIQVCLAKDICDRSFARKDLLKQHVLQMHGVTEAFEVPKIWSREVEFHRINPLAFWCGYCSSTFNSVDERMNHIDAHVQNGSNLGTWKAPTDF